jgi:hypothetical protein
MIRRQSEVDGDAAHSLYRVRFWPLRFAGRRVADADRPPRLRRLAALFACRDSSRADADDRRSRRSAPSAALLRRRDGARGFLFPWPTSYARLADLRVLSFACPLPGGGNGTPARRACESPIAIACLGDRAPCFPRRMCSISSRTNSPAAVVGLFPSRRSCFARSTVVFDGIEVPPR